ncbi:MAG: TRAP transporter small permease, partial [Spirochaetota bacterium]
PSRANRLIVSAGDRLSWIYLLIVLISVYEVFMRYVFNRPTTWVHESSLYLAGIVMVYGGLYAYAKDKHIAVGVVTDLLPERVRTVFYALADVITLLYIALLTLSTILMAKEAVFAPGGAIRLERSGSSWNSVFPGVVKISMSVFLLWFLALVAVHVAARCALPVQAKRQMQRNEQQPDKGASP